MATAFVLVATYLSSSGDLVSDTYLEAPFQVGKPLLTPQTVGGGGDAEMLGG